MNSFAAYGRLEDDLSALAYADVENALLPFRAGRRIILAKIREALVRGELASNSFLFLSRMFCRIKSADSICEKIRRKRLPISSTTDIQLQMVDILGFRLLAETLEELGTIDRYLCHIFEVVDRIDRTSTPGEFGERGIEYSLRYRIEGTTFPFEVQLRTFLHHYWAAASFHLFHKQPRGIAEAKQSDLIRFSNILQTADEAAQSIMQTPETAPALTVETIEPIEGQTRVIAIGAGERFIGQTIVPLTGKDFNDHTKIVESKLAAYARWPGCAVVECSCLDFLTFILNEPHVRIGLDVLPSQCP
jgi:ppGpp synthetase/RelA/SpoT-type nucleotidyltranferase